MQGRTSGVPAFGWSEREPERDSGRQRAAGPTCTLLGRGVDHGGVVLQRAFMESSPRVTRTSEPRGMIANACLEWVLIKEALTERECLEEKRHGAGALTHEMS
ncbi:hypothetical protein GCM10015535_11930 [Streptomyces gelaticus]|uniref:Uncharacterized protein n=1 Tax=Streptomyces gelaticus TaxID=285446 RepID=A0ABQ2VVJ7_9ACTN|nr:hypothetical protein GCM10015535_11930 [Streptomyces gelaticus]